MPILGVIASGQASGPAPYHADAVHFDGATYLLNSALISPAGQSVSYSVWVKLPLVTPSNHSAVIWEADPLGNGVGYAWFQRANSFFLQTFLDDGDTGGPPTTSAVYETLLYDDTWHHLLFSGETSSSPVGDSAQVLYVDGVKKSISLVGNGDAFDMLFNAREFYVGFDAQQGYFEGDLADLWVGTNVSLLVDGDIPPATVAKFIDGDGKPVNPSGFPAGAVLFSGNAAAFPTNLGTGGAFTLTGSLTNASTSPSD